MGDRNYMTPMQKTIAYSAIVVEILAIFSAFGSSIHITYYVFTSSGLTQYCAKYWNFRKIKQLQNAEFQLNYY